ncbi:hypothetical protein B0H16DRAFT_1491088 [Mycena metata]|uniref:Uncharacterized protein n=1 Tax=Mycena metata TaxID=1033252 RepID=A0AAD7P3T2_9AGAR|nr:hypothetical protein B0H16DRAFT_1491088 [Mycena metata]
MAKVKRQPQRLQETPQRLPEKPLPERVADRTLWQSYLALPANTRLKFSVAMAVFAVTGLAVSNYLEKKISASEDKSSDT